jgi:hypothetical protein
MSKWKQSIRRRSLTGRSEGLAEDALNVCIVSEMQDAHRRMYGLTVLQPTINHTLQHAYVMVSNNADDAGSLSHLMQAALVNSDIR